MITGPREPAPRIQAQRNSVGSRSAGKLWKDTGRNQRAIAKVPTDVVAGAEVAGNGPP